MSAESLSEPAEKKSKYEELQIFFAKTKASSSAPRCPSSPTEVLQPVCFQKLYHALNTLPPTSVEAERTFSSAGLFITKLQTSLNYTSVDCLGFFLRKYLNLKIIRMGIGHHHQIFFFLYSNDSFYFS